MAVLSSQLRLSVDDRVTGRMKAISAQMAAFQTRMRAMTAPFTGMTARLAAIGGGYLGVTAGMRGTAGAAIKFEEAFADVVKVLDATPAQIQEVRHRILEMSKVLPNSAEGIAAIYAAAAQSNIPLRELGKFSEMVAKVAVAWDVSEGETSDALAKIKNQLHLNVEQIGLYADAINHLGNNTAAKAPDLVDFSKRVAANGEMFGFSATQTLAFGGAMVAAGAQTEVAATSFRNMGRALTIGTRATKSHQIAFRRLGLDAVKTAKNMQKNALGTTLDVLDRIASLPEWERISIASALFGDEARALMPVIANTTELRRQLGLVGDEANYAGSAYNEYLVRAQTTGNALAIIGNKIKAVGIEIGDGMLPSIKALGQGIGDVLDTLKQRYGIIDQINIAFNSLMTGLGYNGPDGLRAMVNDIGDFLFGEAFDNKDGTLVDQRTIALAKLSNQFRDFGRSIREFGEAVKDNPITKFLAELAGYGFKFFLVATGVTLLAGAVSKLARAMLLLSGASAAIGILKSLGGMGGALFGGLPGKSPGGKVPPAVTTGGGIAALLRQVLSRIPQIALGVGAAYGTGRIAGELSKDNANEARRLANPRDAERESWKAWRDYRDSGGFQEDMDAYPVRRKRTVGPHLPNAKEKPAAGFFNSPAWGHVEDAGNAVTNGLNAVGNWILDWDRRMSESFPSMRTPGAGDGASLVPEIQSLRDAIHQPSGTQNVKVTNPTPVHAPINVTVYATTNADPNAIAQQVGERVQSALSGHYSDGAYA